MNAAETEGGLLPACPVSTFSLAGYPASALPVLHSLELLCAGRPGVFSFTSFRGFSYFISVDDLYHGESSIFEFRRIIP
jgi:hypothetical protein